MSFDKNAWRKARRDKAVAEGLCIICYKKPKEGNLASCSSCREQQKVILKRRVLRSKERGLCVRCHINKVKEDRVTCEPCNEIALFNSRKRNYNLSSEELAELFKVPRCSICGSYDNINIDHDHVTGKVRGLLCGHCNRGLGLFKDNLQYLLEAVDYLKR